MFSPCRKLFKTVGFERVRAIAKSDVRSPPQPPMKKKTLIIAAIVVFILGLVGYFIISKSTPASSVNNFVINANDKSCLSDSDCVAVAKDCSSSSCGQAINRFSAAKYEKDGVKVCPDYKNISACEASTPKCLSGSCTLSLSGVDSSLPFYTIRQINRTSLPPGIYNTEGYVYNIYECPACPTGKFCATCLAPHIVLSQIADGLTLAKDEILETHIIVRIPNPEEFTRSNKYRFSVRIPADYKFSNSYKESFRGGIEMVAYEPVDF